MIEAMSDSEDEAEKKERVPKKKWKKKEAS